MAGCVATIAIDYDVYTVAVGVPAAASHTHTLSKR